MVRGVMRWLGGTASALMAAWLFSFLGLESCRFEDVNRVWEFDFVVTYGQIRNFCLAGMIAIALICVLRFLRWCVQRVKRFKLERSEREKRDRNRMLSLMRTFAPFGVVVRGTSGDSERKIARREMENCGIIPRSTTPAHQLHHEVRELMPYVRTYGVRKARRMYLEDKARDEGAQRAERDRRRRQRRTAQRVEDVRQMER